MSMQVLERICAERDEVRAAAVAIAESDDFTPDDKTFIDLQTRAQELDARAATMANLIDQQASADALDARFSRAQRRADERRAEPREPEHWADVFLRSEEFTSYAGRGTSRKVEVEMRALPHSLTSLADAMPSAPVYDLTPAALPPMLLPLVNVVSVSQNSVDWIRWSKVTAPAAPKSSAAVVPEGTIKPSIEWEPDVTSSSLVTVAAHTSFTRQMASDLPAVRSYLTGELSNEVSRKVEEEAIDALNDATIPSATGPADTGLLGAIRAGQAAVQAVGGAPNGFLVASEDLVGLDLAVMATAGTAPNQTNSFWGLQPVIDPNRAAGSGVVVGDFRRAITHYRRTAVELFVTDSHGENFRLNILDAIAEQRCLTVVTRPDFLVEATEG